MAPGTGKTSINSQDIRDLAITDADVAAANKDGTAATPSMRTLGTGATQAAAGNDSRLVGTGNVPLTALADQATATMVGRVAAGSGPPSALSASDARSAMGLGTAALSASGDFQPIDSDLTAIAALSTTTYGRAFLAMAGASDLTALTSGTAFPTGAALTAYGNNRPFFRTDLGEWYYYDGTRWLSSVERTIYFDRTVLPGAGYTAYFEIHAANPANGADILITTANISWAGATPQSVGNDWYLQLYKIPNGSGSTTQFGPVPATTGMAIGVWNSGAVGINTVVTWATGPRLHTAFIKNGSAGQLYDANVSLNFRKVAT